MIKTNRKWISLLLALTLAWLLQISAMPVSASSAAENAASTGAEQGPSFVELEKTSGNSARGKGILPYVLVGVGVAAVAAVLVLVVFKAQYDIVGTWTVHLVYDEDDSSWDSITVFSGTRKSGTTLDNYEATGTYAVDGKKVAFTLSWSNTIVTFSGQFDGKDNMSGTFDEASKWTGTWTAVRGASPARVPGLKTSWKARGPGRMKRDSQ